MDKHGIGLLVVVILIFIAAIFAAYLEVEESKTAYNDGICVKCGGEYRFASAVHFRSSGDHYYYNCENCGHTIMTYSLMK